MSWFPAGLPANIVALAKAVDQRFQQLNPNGPVRQPSYTTSELADLVPTAPASAINSTARKPVFAVPNSAGTGFVWVYADGTTV